MSALNEQLKDGPVWVIANNTPKYVVLFAEDFRRMRREAFERDCREAMDEIKAGLAEPTNADELVAEAFGE